MVVEEEFIIKIGVIGRQGGGVYLGAELLRGYPRKISFSSKSHWSTER